MIWTKFAYLTALGVIEYLFSKFAGFRDSVMIIFELFKRETIGLKTFIAGQW